MIPEPQKDQHLQVIKKILDPLEELLGVRYFTYCLFTDTHCECVSSDPDAAQTFLHDQQSALPIAVTNRNAILEWGEYCSTSYCEFIFDRYRGCNGVTFVLTHHDGTSEYIALNSNDSAIKLKQTLLSTPGLTNRIVSHIRNHVQFHRDKLEIITFKKRESPKTEASEKVNVDLIPVQTREYVYGLNGPTYITKAEKKCLLLLLQMKTSKQISEKIFTSVRTVETHIANIKKKLGTQNRHQLYEIAVNNFILPADN